MTVYTYISRNGPLGHMVDYFRHFGFLEDTVKIHYPSANIILNEGKASKDLFIERISGLLDTLKRKKGSVIYCDADTVFISKVDLFSEYDFDIAVPYKFYSPGFPNSCQAGVVMFSGKRREREILWCEHWLEEAKNEFSRGEYSFLYDQVSMNRIIGVPSKKRLFEDYLLPDYYEPHLENKYGLKILYVDNFKYACPTVLPYKVKPQIITSHQRIFHEIGISEKEQKKFMNKFVNGVKNHNYSEVK